MNSPPRDCCRAAYRTPTLEVLGSLRNATRGTGSGMADSAGSMTTGNMGKGSDRRIKEDITKVGCHPLGLGIYRFRYTAPYAKLYGAGRQIGVMADEVAAKFPQAVSRHADGHLIVDYGQLFH
jgi:hypothetical protein